MNNEYRVLLTRIPLDHFTVAAKLPGLGNGSEAAGDPVLIQTFGSFSNVRAVFN